MLIIKQERLRHGWTQEYVGSQVGVSAEAVGMIEAGKRKPSYQVLVELENIFKLSHRELFAQFNENTNV